MKTSSTGRALIEQREGKRLSAYLDTVGVWTIGVGHTGRMAPPKVAPGMTITDAQCDVFLTADLAPVETAINASVAVPLSQNEFDALASLGFNIGTSGLKRSTVVRSLNLGDVEGAADAFRQWERPAVLAGRREAERTQFLMPDPTSGAIATARAGALASRAEATKAKARMTQTAGAAASLGGAAAAAATVHTGHHGIALALFGLVVVGAIVDGVVAWRHHKTAGTLTANIAKASASATPPAASTPVATPSLVTIAKD